MDLLMRTRVNFFPKLSFYGRAFSATYKDCPTLGTKKKEKKNKKEESKEKVEGFFSSLYGTIFLVGMWACVCVCMCVCISFFFPRQKRFSDPIPFRVVF